MQLIHLAQSFLNTHVYAHPPCLFFSFVVTTLIAHSFFFSSIPKTTGFLSVLLYTTRREDIGIPQWCVW